VGGYRYRWCLCVSLSASGAWASKLQVEDADADTKQLARLQLGGLNNEMNVAEERHGTSTRIWYAIRASLI
jgi:hypothetical protein